MRKMLVFDMDGTIADLYNVPNWLAMITNEDVTPYVTAKPLYDMITLVDILSKIKKNGWIICITTWTAKNASKNYNKKTATAKKEWLKKYNFPFDEFHAIKYGTTKANATRKKADFQILIDDNKKVRDGWTLGTTVNANYDITNFLKSLI